VACSQAAVLENLRCIGGGVRQFYDGDLMIGWLPLFHDMGLVATTLSALAHGIPVALMPPAAFVLRPARFLWAVHVLRASLAFAPNFAYRLCLRRLSEDDADLRGLDSVFLAHRVQRRGVRAGRKRLALSAHDSATLDCPRTP